MTIISSSILFTTKILANGKRSMANWIVTLPAPFLGGQIKFGVCIMNMHNKE